MATKLPSHSYLVALIRSARGDELTPEQSEQLGGLTNPGLARMEALRLNREYRGDRRLIAAYRAADAQ